MINEDKKGLEDVLRHNDAIQRTQEREEDLQHQEKAWRKDKLIRKAQEEEEERKEKSELNSSMNK